MPVGLPLAIMLFTAQATATAPTTQRAPGELDPQAAQQRCPTPGPPPRSGEIVICAERPHGYRLNPDVMEARREIRSGGRPKPPENYKETNCAVGPMGCGPQAGINLIGAALTAAEIASRLAKGQEVGSMFVTDPHPTEYQLYLEAKKRREDKEAAEAAKAAADAVKARMAAQAAKKPAATVDPPSGQRD